MEYILLLRLEWDEIEVSTTSLRQRYPTGIINVVGEAYEMGLS